MKQSFYKLQIDIYVIIDLLEF